MITLFLFGSETNINLKQFKGMSQQVNTEDSISQSTAWKNTNKFTLENLIQ